MILAGVLHGADTAAKPVSYDDDEEDSGEAAKLSPSERAARKACVICHAFPTPDMLDRKHWVEQVLPRMKVRLGVVPPDYTSSPEGELIRSRKIYTDKPLIPLENWRAVENHFVQNAPEEPLSQQSHAEIGIGLKLFLVEAPRFRLPIPLTTLVKISASRRQIFTGDDKEQTLSILDQEGALVQSFKTGNVPVDVVEADHGIYVTCIGSFQPSEVYRGEFLFYPKKGDSFGEKEVLLRELPRPVQAKFADFNGDGKLDFALCMFGNLTGRFSWFENLGDGDYKEHVLSSKAGSITCVVEDLDGDSKPDLSVLMAQEMEMLVMMLNDGKGNFTGDTVLQRPAVWGHVHFEFADFNKDGRKDLLIVNGDNGEYDSPLKRYHGIRVYLNKGVGKYEEAFFYPVNGCYKAIARDFDEDGDLDIASISFFPDYQNAPKESFIYLENQGGMRFTASTFRECIAGRWLVLDADDLDGDGDLDLVLGAYAMGPSPVPAFLMDVWKQQGPSVQILRNMLKERQGAR